MIPNDILSFYSELKRTDVMEAVELAVAKVLTRTFQMPFTVHFTQDGLKMTGLPHCGEPVEITPDKIGKKLRRHVLFTIEVELQKRQALHEAERLRQLQGKVLQGVVAGYEADGSALVEMELSNIYRRIILLGTCPLRYQPMHERNKYTAGKVYHWFVTSVLPVASERNAKVRIRLSRTSKELPALLLRQMSGIERIICHRRIPGGPAEIITARKIPKDIINSVGKETGDIYRVRIIQ
ncbi:hypothetical protein A2G06_16520 (plasmid) [Geobacter anodireducens]|nr:hypothetical protein A2G06_16520 [Geobacter anodireducens]